MMVYDFSMEWSYHGSYVRIVRHVIPALRLALYMLTQYQQKLFGSRFPNSVAFQDPRE